MSVLSWIAPRRLFAFLSLAASCCAVSVAQQSTQAVLASAPLITQPVDEQQLTVLKGNTHPLARPQFDLGSAPATLPMQRMLLVLKRGPEEEFALRALLDNQQDKKSASYHKWLTPEQFGKIRPGRRGHPDHHFVAAVARVPGGNNQRPHRAGILRVGQPGEGSVSYHDPPLSRKWYRALGKLERSIHSNGAHSSGSGGADPAQFFEEAGAAHVAAAGIGEDSSRKTAGNHV